MANVDSRCKRQRAKVESQRTLVHGWLRLRLTAAGCSSTFIRSGIKDVVLNSRSDEPHERLQLLYHYYSTIKLSHYYTVLLGFSDKTHRFNS